MLSEQKCKPRAEGAESLCVRWSADAYLSNETPFYFLAARFAAFAFLQSIGYIPNHDAMAFLVEPPRMHCGHADKMSGTEAETEAACWRFSFVTVFRTFVTASLGSCPLKL